MFIRCEYTRLSILTGGDLERLDLIHILKHSLNGDALFIRRIYCNLYFDPTSYPIAYRPLQNVEKPLSHASLSSVLPYVDTIINSSWLQYDLDFLAAISLRAWLLPMTYLAHLLNRTSNLHSGNLVQ